VLRPALEVGLDAGRLESRGQLGDRPADVVLATLAPRVEQAGELAEPIRLEDLEREILELPLDLPDPEALGKRGVDLLRLAGDPELLLRRQAVQGPHVVEAIGELDEDDPDVLGHRQEHLADVLGLLLLMAVGAEPRQLRHAVDEPGDLGTEAILDVGEAVLGVFGDVMEDRGSHRDRVDPELGRDLGRGDRMRHVWFAGRPPLALVGLHREIERPLDRLEVGLRIVLPDGSDELPLETVEIWLGRGSGRARGRGPARRAPRPARLGSTGGGGRDRPRGIHRCWRVHAAALPGGDDRSRSRARRRAGAIGSRAWLSHGLQDSSGPRDADRGSRSDPLSRPDGLLPARRRR
jgi:hypothetical protein